MNRATRSIAGGRLSPRCPNVGKRERYTAGRQLNRTIEVAIAKTYRGAREEASMHHQVSPTAP